MLAPLFLVIANCVTSVQSYEYYYISVNSNESFDGWYHFLEPNETPPHISAALDQNTMTRIYQHGNQQNYFVISKLESRFGGGNNYIHDYIWSLNRVCYDCAQRTKCYNGGCDQIKPSHINESGVHAKQVTVTVHWQELQSIDDMISQRCKSRVHSLHDYVNYRDLMIGNLTLQNQQLHETIMMFKQDLINTTQEQMKLKIENQQLRTSIITRTQERDNLTIATNEGVRLEFTNKQLQKELSELKDDHKKYIAITSIIIVIISIICVVITVLFWCNARKGKIYRDWLQQMHKYGNEKQIERPNILNRSGNALPNKNINLMVMKNEGNKTIGNLNREKFSDMLDNSQMVSDVIVDDIINDMQTEGRKKSVIKKLHDENLDFETDDGAITRL
eukprot:52167_1